MAPVNTELKPAGQICPWQFERVRVPGGIETAQNFNPMKTPSSIRTNFLPLLLAGTTVLLTLTARAEDAAKGDLRDDASPWAFGSSAEWSDQYPKFNPLMSQAGSRWVRLWPEWSTIQPKQGEWKWEKADAILADARKNNLRVLGNWCYFAPWTSANGGTRKGPIKDIQFWRDYTEASAIRYKLLLDSGNLGTGPIVHSVSIHSKNP